MAPAMVCRSCAPRTTHCNIRIGAQPGGSVYRFCSASRSVFAYSAPAIRQYILTPNKEAEMAKAKRLPKEVFIYVCDTLDDGTPVYGDADSVDDIPEDSNGHKVGNYY